MRNGVLSTRERELLQRGPAWREHPDYYAPPVLDDPDDIPWHSEADVEAGYRRVRAHVQRSAPLVRLMWDLLTPVERLNLVRAGFGVPLL